MKWKNRFEASALKAAQDYVDAGKVTITCQKENVIEGIVDALQPYKVKAVFRLGELEGGSCGCLYGRSDYFCRHIAALILQAGIEDETALPKFPDIPNIPGVPNVPGMPSIPGAPNTPDIPQAPEQGNRQLDPAGTKDSDEAYDGGILMMKAEKNGVVLQAEGTPVISYALLYNRLPVIEMVKISSNSEKDLKELTLTISDSKGYLEPFEIQIDLLPAQDYRVLSRPVIRGDLSKIIQMNDSDRTDLEISVKKKERILVQTKAEVQVLPYDQWPGLRYHPVLLASFVQPTHPAMQMLVHETADLLESWGQDRAIEGYQSGDINRVRTLAAAAYGAIQKKNITYASPPSTYDMVGQKVRLADAVLDQRLGNCMDMTLLYCSLLEAMKLNPFFVFVKGHIFAGVWLKDQSFENTIMDDPSHLDKRMASGMNDLLVVECTAMNSNKQAISFENACESARLSVIDYRDFQFAIDILRARDLGIRSLPQRTRDNGEYKVEVLELEESQITRSPTTSLESYDLPDQFEEQKPTKLLQWETKLLDLSGRNILLNIPQNGSIITLLTSDLATLEDALADGHDFSLLPVMKEIQIPDEISIIETVCSLSQYQKLLNTELKHHRLHSCLSEGELNRKMNAIYRSARTSMEENGVSTLYLSMGQLRWPDDNRFHYAPVVLIPVDVVRKGARQGYMIRMRDEDAQINITLLEFLKQKFNIKIKGLLPPPEDESGLNIPLIFTIIRRAIVNLPNWEFFEAACLGNFQFSQFIMWNDVHSNPQFLQKNKITASLINGQIEFDPVLPEPINPGDLSLPVLADSSQVQAIHAAEVGSSFVLHGPPGTGKSQTITAMIANALGHGKTVLFVAEKKAALEVVQSRLEKLGLADFCLELHSNKATKKAILDHLAKGLDQLEKQTSPDYQQKVKTCRELRQKLDGYAKALHEKGASGMSLYELIARYEDLPDQTRVLYLNADWASTITEADMSAHRQALRQLATAGEDCAVLKKGNQNPLMDVHQTEYSQDIRFKLPEMTDALKRSVQKLEESAKTLGKAINQPFRTASELASLEQNARSICDLEELPAFINQTASIEAAFEKPLMVMKKREELKSSEDQLKEIWDPAFLIKNMQEYENSYAAASKKLFGKAKAISRLADSLQGFVKVRLNPDDLPVQFSRITLYQNEKKSLEDLENTLSDQWLLVLNKAQTSEKLIQKREEWIRVSAARNSLPEGVRSAVENQGLSSLQTLVANFMAQDAVFRGGCSSIAQLLACRKPEKEENWAAYWNGLCDSLMENASSLKEWIVYQKARKTAADLNLMPFVESYESGTSTDELMNQYEKSMEQAMILSLIAKSAVLNEFTGNSFNETISQFAELDRQLQDLTREELQIRLQQAKPSNTKSVELNRQMNILRRAIRSNGRGISIRLLFEQIPDVLPKLCPCLLMSPMSVSQYLQPKNDLFDLVIFDEASQVPTCKAIGAIARAKNAIIAGDPNQMPPTSFFAGRILDEENLDLEDLDSILDDCLALGMPSVYLKWHYRSHHESLIAFSNQHFYENRMETFPSANDLEKRVSLRKVNGYFDRGRSRTNGAEAEAIVKEIRRRYKNPETAQQSIGVITFNLQQQNLIEDLLIEEYKKDSAFEKWASQGDELLFIKNLENVQGDERDVILFSVAYGPDRDGKMLMNFGPLTRDGGWKRLNVAITRARDEMMVFTSMDADDIDLRRSKSTGAAALKDFLEYAGRSTAGSRHEHEQDEFSHQGILRQICQIIADKGLDYVTHIGMSDIQIDVAIVNPYKKDEYLLGILLDGRQYYSTLGTRDREISQISILEGLGWRIERFWTMDWWDKKEKEKQRLSRIVDEILEQARLKAERQPDHAEAELSAENPDGAAESENDKENEPTAPDETVPESLPDDGMPSIPDSVTEIQQPEEASFQSAEEPEPGLEEKEEEGISTSGGLKSTDTPNAEPARGNDAYASRVIPEGSVENEKEKSEAEKQPEKSQTETSDYSVADYVEMDELTTMSTRELLDTNNFTLIVEKMSKIIELEGPIELNALYKKTMRLFGISRSSDALQEVLEKALKKVKFSRKSTKDGTFCWPKTLNPSEYRLFRVPTSDKNRRTVQAVAPQELKNAAVIVLQNCGPLKAEDLVKEMSRLMKFTRMSASMSDDLMKAIQYATRMHAITRQNGIYTVVEEKTESEQTE